MKKTILLVILLLAVTASAATVDVLFPSKITTGDNSSIWVNDSTTIYPDVAYNNYPLRYGGDPLVMAVWSGVIGDDAAFCGIYTNTSTECGFMQDDGGATILNGATGEEVQIRVGGTTVASTRGNGPLEGLELFGRIDLFDEDFPGIYHNITGAGHITTRNLNVTNITMNNGGIGFMNCTGTGNDFAFNYTNGTLTWGCIN